MAFEWFFRQQGSDRDICVECWLRSKRPALTTVFIHGSICVSGCTSNLSHRYFGMHWALLDDLCPPLSLTLYLLQQVLRRWAPTLGSSLLFPWIYTYDVPTGIFRSLGNWCRSSCQPIHVWCTCVQAGRPVEDSFRTFPGSFLSLSLAYLFSGTL